VNDVLFRGAVVRPDGLVEDGGVLCADGRIVAVGSDVESPPGALEVKGAFVAPGFVDIHVHGGDGADFMDGTRDAVLTATRAHARHGTTTIFPTTTTGSPDQLEAMLAACASAPSGSGARVAGVHLYGPFFAADKLGCHGAGGRRDPEPGEYERYLESGLVRIATCAAELPGAEAYYEAAAARDCLVTCGHSNASWGEMERAFAAGVRHVDHFWCAMSSVPSVAERLGTPMQGSMEQFVLLRDEMSTEVIADGAHLAPELLESPSASRDPRGSAWSPTRAAPSTCLRASTASGRRPTARRSRATASSGDREPGWRARSRGWTGWCGRWSGRRARRFPRRCGWRA